MSAYDIFKGDTQPGRFLGQGKSLFKCDTSSARFLTISSGAHVSFVLTGSEMLYKPATLATGHSIFGFYTPPNSVVNSVIPIRLE